MLKIGVIGYGYWGPNIVRNFHNCSNAKVVAVSDKREEVLSKVKVLYPDISVSKDPFELIKSVNVDAVAIVTPVTTHFELAKQALENGKHIFVEKPFTASLSEANILIDLAEKTNLKIMVDHTFLFTGAVQKIKSLIDDGTIGKLYYYDSTRVNLGLFQHDINVIWDLAPHDFSIMDFLLNEKPESLVATGMDHFNHNNENLAYITLYFKSNLIAHFNVNWLSPVKIRSTLIGGEKQMIVWNDLSADEKIKVYDKSVQVENREGIYDLMFNYRVGDMYSPKINHVEALQSETQYFVKCVEQNISPINDGLAGRKVVELLTATDESIKEKGKRVFLTDS
ncbi:MAG: Gfo/Idh/MocA family oxidoreductase [Fibrobacteria bacterium]|nr:Gfo/Idh/MocA family oxidoreductase [Fibrobacteria bacterium]